MQMIRLGVNIDHVATVRQARHTIEPDPVQAAAIAEKAGADGITVHLREDRRHINDLDVRLLRKSVHTRLNLEMSVAAEIVDIARKLRPDQATLVPERRQEITTEGGLNVAGKEKKIKSVVECLKEKNILVSIFIEPEEKQIAAAKNVGADYIELHTGAFANALSLKLVEKQLNRLSRAASYAKELGLGVNAGHGLTYLNTKLLVEAVPEIEELNIGHSIISRAIMVGLHQAVSEMKAIIASAAKG
ncbi:MAG: pyridoxine 5'-phosphate synthase [Candidatus Omnitrophica bacterium]|nr:pyridoxine 5'-phosphate synthase [Candidatus Omnitrophota bacterium]